MLQNRWDIQMYRPHVNCITTATKIIRLKFIRSAKRLTFRKRNTKEQKYISIKVSEAAKIKAYETFCFFKIIKTYQKTNRTFLLTKHIKGTYDVIDKFIVVIRGRTTTRAEAGLFRCAIYGLAIL